MKKTLFTLVLLSLVLCLGSCAGLTKSSSGFKRIFDGKTLDGWKSDNPKLWSVEEGAITAKITEKRPAARNHYLVYQGGELKDFELKMKHRVLSEKPANCGFQFRSKMFDGLITNDCRGYQVDNNTQTPWAVRLYDEHGRETLAWRGENTVFAADGAKTTTPIEGATGPAHFSLDKWHEYHLICQGAHIVLKVDGKLVAEVTDNDEKNRDLAGVLALQLHNGPPMTVQFKDVRLKVLN